MAQINMPQQRQKKDPLDTILKGLNIASSFYNIKQAGEQADRLKQQLAMQSDQADTAEFAAAEKQAFDQEKFAADEKARNRQLDNEDLKTKAYVANLSKTGGESSLANQIKQLQLDELKRKNALVSSPEGRMQALPSSDKQRLDNARLAFQSVGEMTNALGKGDWTFSPVGDNDFTLARTKFEEALGRMQSGGAIQNDEAARFRKMAPTAMDSNEMQLKKLTLLQNEFGQRLQTLGFKPEDFNLAYSTPGQSENQIAGAFKLPQANAAAAPQGLPVPKQGTVDDGYVFRGGNPKDPKNWEKMK